MRDVPDRPSGSVVLGVIGAVAALSMLGCSSPKSVDRRDVSGWLQFRLSRCIREALEEGVPVRGFFDLERSGKLQDVQAAMDESGGRGVIPRGMRLAEVTSSALDACWDGGCLRVYLFATRNGVVLLDDGANKLSPLLCSSAELPAEIETLAGLLDDDDFGLSVRTEGGRTTCVAFRKSDVRP